MKLTDIMTSRRRFLAGTFSLGAAGALLPASLNASSGQPTELHGPAIDLTIGESPVNFTGRKRTAVTVNNQLPAPTLRLREGDTVTLRVTNTLAEMSSIHWHGIVLPSNMDGVPGLSFHGIHPGETFTYQYTLQQHGTYWYHGHSGFQEQQGLYGALIVEPKSGLPYTYDREHVVLLSDWSDESPAMVLAKLRKLPHYYNTHERTLGDLWLDIREKGVAQTFREREMWNTMRMSDRDISDVTGATYTFLMNGNAPDMGWTGLFRNGEKVLLRFINAAAMTFFDVRIPGLKMTVVAADGNAVQPVSVDDFRIGVAETYDVIVEPENDTPYTVFAQAIDRSGFARGTLTPHPSLDAPIPEMDPRPILTHTDMGMAHADHAQHAQDSNDGSDDPHAAHRATDAKKADPHAGHRMPQPDDKPVTHAKTEYGPQVDMRAEAPQYRLDDPGVGLRDHQRLYGRKVLTYADLQNRYHTHNAPEPTREIELHLTGNMARYLWSFDGVPFADAEPILLRYGERVRFTLVNDTMMNHPIHLHGLWSDLETGNLHRIPRKHTVIVQPGAKISFRVTADMRGRWAFHCHLLYHMAGMFREVRVE